MNTFTIVLGCQGEKMQFLNTFQKETDHLTPLILPRYKFNCSWLGCRIYSYLINIFFNNVVMAGYVKTYPKLSFSREWPPVFEQKTWKITEIITVDESMNLKKKLPQVFIEMFSGWINWNWIPSLGAQTGTF